MRSVRLRLLIIALLPLIVVLPLLFGVTMVRWINKFDDLLIAKVASDLRVAEQYFTQIEADTAFKVAALAQSARFASAREAGPDAFAALLSDERRALGLDYLIYRDADNIALPAPAASLVTAAEPDAPIAALALFNASELAAISPDLALLAEIPLVPTEAARQIDRTAETRGMVLQTAYRTTDGQSVLLRGQLLNRNL